MDFYDLLLAKKLSGGGGGSITPQIKQALLACFSKVAWVDENGQDYYETLLNAMYSPADLVSISAVYNGGYLPQTATLDDIKTDLVVTASWSDSSTSIVGANYYTLSGTLEPGINTISVSYLGKTTTFNVSVILWSFSDGYAISKGTSGASKNMIWRASTAARACGLAPIENKNYVFTVTDSSKYNLCAYDVTNNTPSPTTQSGAIDGQWYQGGTKSISWKASDSASSEYVWLSLKKMDGTAFTAEELADGAAAVFTYTAN